MSDVAAIQCKHVCPRNCFSACTMISSTEKGRLIHLAGDENHPYTKGKLCSKGYSYIERNYHSKRLKYPLYQEEKGSGNFHQITWERAFHLIEKHLNHIFNKYKSFLPFALYKYSGNLGVHHYVTDEFFSSLSKTTRIVGSPCSSAGIEALEYSTGSISMSDPAQIAKSDLIFLWGTNPASTNIHLIPFILKAKRSGAKVIVIDPLYTETAEHADLFIQLVPGTDGALANIIIKELISQGEVDHSFLKNHSYGFESYCELVNKISSQRYLQTCGVPEAAIDLLVAWLKEAKAVSHMIGFGLQRHSNGGQNIRAIEALAAVRGDIGREGGGAFYTHGESMIFNNQQIFSNSHLDEKNRIVNMNKWINGSLSVPIEMMWIACRNPLTQDPNPQAIQKHLENIPFVVTVDQFLTPTAEMSNLILPTTTHFEELDIVTSYFHKVLALNERAVSPYYESRSEWEIITEMASRIKQIAPEHCSFPTYKSEEDYLNAQFNEYVFEKYGVHSIADLRKVDGIVVGNFPTIAWENKTFLTPTGKFEFYSLAAKQNGFSPTPIYIEGKLPSVDYPFWLITPHHPYALNSQFDFLHLSEEKEACVEMNAEFAKKLGIYDGEVIKIFNEQDTIEIKAIYSTKVPKDILLIYEGWYQNSQIIINRLVPVLETDMGEKVAGANGVAFYDTFVNVAKL
ncbi:molybdopterin-dependent oxidoreductase [Bacillus sp. B15-48]|uniref:molybdopterin-dependent oxidoreductase n=1 Tax=Bacillus sp. B15-48 TaxID=1548601 RepID=UPI00193F39B8|nr:molybdopterin-dependent oxidoreductase [Bacillus sp. B15-48]MBM4760843.1 molybdopterin-dependent oxidoreductase [Bacillus sp. B15-48]